MKIALWTLAGLLMLLWTSGAWVVASVATWAQGAIASGAGVDWSAVAASTSLPAWVTWWIDPGPLVAIISAGVSLLEMSRDAMPWLGTVSEWVTALMWMIWGVGTVVLLVVTAAGHWAIGRLAHHGV